VRGVDAATGTWTISDSAGRNWGVLPDGSLRVLRPAPQCAPLQKDVRDGIPLARQCDKLMVLEWRAVFSDAAIDRARPDSIGGWRTNLDTLVPNAYGSGLNRADFEDAPSTGHAARRGQRPSTSLPPFLSSMPEASTRHATGTASFSCSISA